LTKARSSEGSESLPSEATSSEYICSLICVWIERERVDGFAAMEVFELVDEDITDDGEVRRSNNFLTSFEISKSFPINLLPFQNPLVDRSSVELKSFQTAGPYRFRFRAWDSVTFEVLGTIPKVTIY